jgi:regulator of protease activity HflC (stomatin/prohibitin superfamily)
MSLSETQQKQLRERARHRFKTRLGLLAIFISGLVLSGLLYFETTALAPGRAALVVRGGELRRVVVDAGRVWRIPVLDRIVLVDLRAQPLPTLRQTVAGTGGRATVELHLSWQVADAAAYWRSTGARPELAARQIEGEVERALRAALAGQPVAGAWSGETRQRLAAAIEADAAPALKRAGLKLVELRVTSVQAIR